MLSVKWCIFVQKGTSFTQKLFWGEGQQTPLLHTIHTNLIPRLNQKKKIKEVQTKSRIQTTYLTP